MVEGARLESVYAGNRIAGSNPAPSAITEIKVQDVAHLKPTSICPKQVLWSDNPLLGDPRGLVAEKPCRVDVHYLG